jgi:hypothetical protein
MSQTQLPAFNLCELRPFGKIIIRGGRRSGKTTLVGRIRVAMSLPRTTVVARYESDARFYSNAFCEETSSKNVRVFQSRCIVDLKAEYSEMHNFATERLHTGSLLCEMLKGIRELAQLILLYLRLSDKQVLVLEEVDTTRKMSLEIPHLSIHCDPDCDEEVVPGALVFLHLTSSCELYQAYKDLARFVGLRANEFETIYQREIGYEGDLGSFLVFETRTGNLSRLAPLSDVPNNWHLIM